MDTIEFAHEDGIGVITLSREKALNALNSTLLNELAHVLSELMNSGLRALVITGAGDRAFAAGADISEMASFSAEEAEAFSSGGQAVLELLETFPAPTIAAVKGFALGGGCEVAMACGGERVELESPQLEGTPVEVLAVDAHALSPRQRQREQQLCKMRTT